MHNEMTREALNDPIQAIQMISRDDDDEDEDIPERPGGEYMGQIT